MSVYSPTQDLADTSQPIAFTNTISVGKVYDALCLWHIDQARKAGDDDIEGLRHFSIPVVGETYDGLMNDISASVIEKSHVYAALEDAKTREEVLEGNYGGGTAMRCHGYKGGTGTSSRIIPGDGRDYIVGVLVQANHGQKPDLRIGNVPVGEFLSREESKDASAGASNLPVGGKAAEGSILVLIM